MINEQLKEWFAQNGLKQKDIVEATGLKKSFISELLAGKRNIGRETAERLSACYGLSVQWLMTGGGEMLRADQSQQPQQADTDEVEALRRRIAELEATVERQNRVIDALTGVKDSCNVKRIG